jgi:hypothetical protein
MNINSLAMDKLNKMTSFFSEVRYKNEFNCLSYYKKGSKTSVIKIGLSLGPVTNRLCSLALYLLMVWPNIILKSIGVVTRELRTLLCLQIRRMKYIIPKPNKTSCLEMAPYLGSTFASHRYYYL